MTLSVLLALLLNLMTGQVASPSRVLPPLLPLKREVALAEGAAPRDIAKHASIFVLRRGGFVLERKGQNGFTCFVARTEQRYVGRKGALLGFHSKISVELCSAPKLAIFLRPSQERGYESRKLAERVRQSPCQIRPSRIARGP